MCEEYKIVQALRDRGYHIDTTTKETLFDTVEKASQKVNSLATQIKMKHNQMVEKAKRAGKIASFSSYRAGLNIKLKFREDENITLAEYNSYCIELAKQAKLKPQEDGSRN